MNAFLAIIFAPAVSAVLVIGVLYAYDLATGKEW
jgi:hypothetical protein